MDNLTLNLSKSKAVGTRCDSIANSWTESNRLWKRDDSEMEQVRLVRNWSKREEMRLRWLSEQTSPPESLIQEYDYSPSYRANPITYQNDGENDKFSVKYVQRPLQCL